MYDRLFKWFQDNAFINLPEIDNLAASFQSASPSGSQAQLPKVVVDESFCGAVFYSRHPQHAYVDIMTDRMQVVIDDVVFCNTIDHMYDGIYDVAAENPEGVKQLITDGWSVNSNVDDLLRAYVAWEVCNGLNSMLMRDGLRQRLVQTVNLWAAYGVGHDPHMLQDKEGMSIHTAVSLLTAASKTADVFGFSGFYRNLYYTVVCNGSELPCRLNDLDAKDTEPEKEEMSIKDVLAEGIARMKLK